MAKPNVLCKLKQGVLIDTFPGFVATFNYIVDFISNLCGDGDNDAAKHVKVDRTVPDFPVIKFDGSAGGGTFKVVGTDGTYAIVGDTSASDYKTLTFASESDSNVTVKVSGTDGNATVTIGVYYK